MLTNWPVVHLECGIAAVSGEAHHVVFADIDRSFIFFDGDINFANIEDNSNFPLFYMKLPEISKSWGTVNEEQAAVLHRSAEAHFKVIRACPDLPLAGKV